MSHFGKPVRLSKHARGQLRFRGATEEEVTLAIRTGPWGVADQGRLDCRKDFPFGSSWHGKTYTTKQVRPIFVDERDAIVVVTVYVYYFSKAEV
jgi:hypothetical protein